MLLLSAFGAGCNCCCCYFVLPPLWAHMCTQCRSCQIEGGVCPVCFRQLSLAMLLQCAHTARALHAHLVTY